MCSNEVDSNDGSLASEVLWCRRLFPTGRFPALWCHWCSVKHVLGRSWCVLILRCPAVQLPPRRSIRSVVSHVLLSQSDSTCEFWMTFCDFSSSRRSHYSSPLLPCISLRLAWWWWRLGPKTLVESAWPTPQIDVYERNPSFHWRKTSSSWSHGCRFLPIGWGRSW